MINPGEHVSIFGMTGCGKSTLTRKLSELYSRKIIFDRLIEWNDDYTVCSDFDEFSVLYKQCFEFDEFTIIFRPRAGSETEEITQTTDAILGLIFQIESQESKGIALIFEEVWIYAPLQSCPPWLTQIALTGRHYNVCIIANSQRPAHVSKTLVTQSRHVFIGQFFEANDRKYLFETLGKLEELNSPPPPGEFIWFRPADPKNTRRITVF